MNFAPLYLLNRFFFRFTDFLHHWYIGGSRALGASFMNTLEGWDRVLALRVTLHYFTHPLYGDYSVIGRILGIIFRSFRILLALILYAICAAFFLAIYIVWLVLPFIPLILAYRSFIR